MVKIDQLLEEKTGYEKRGRRSALEVVGHRRQEDGAWIIRGHLLRHCQTRPLSAAAREFFIGNLLVRIHFIIVMIRWTGLAPWEFEDGPWIIRGHLLRHF